MTKKAVNKLKKEDHLKSVKRMPNGKPLIESVTKNAYLPFVIILLFSTGIYFNTLWNTYAIDDFSVISKNAYTVKGFHGIKDLMTHDALVGYVGESANKSTGTRYRPLSMVTFAIEIGLVGERPMLSHGINIFLFALTCLLLYRLLSYLLPPAKGTSFYLSLPFLATMFFAAHPIHTEAVANIKGRDEIMGLLFALLAAYAAVRYAQTHKVIHLIWGAPVYLLALLSKENPITYIAVIPLMLYFFTSAKAKEILLCVGVYLIPVSVFLLMRYHYTGGAAEAVSTEVLKNPWAYLASTPDGYIHRYATIIMTFILYFKLLIFPHPLTHDYFYNHVPIVGISDMWFILSVLVNMGLVIYAIMGFGRRQVASFAILYYFITFSIVSNLIFNTGGVMSERFVYMPSIGFCILLAQVLITAKERYTVGVSGLTGVMMGILILYSIKTISRNRDWENNLILIVTDSRTSTNSEKVQSVAGMGIADMAGENFELYRENGTLQKVIDLLGMNEDASTVSAPAMKMKLLERAIEYLKRALAIDTNSSYAWNSLGEISYKLHKDPNEAIGYYLKAKDMSSGNYSGTYFVSWNNMGCVHLEMNMPALAKDDFLKAMSYKPNEPGCRVNVALAYSKMGDVDSAILWYQKALEVNPKDAKTCHDLGKIYGKDKHDMDKAIVYISKAIEINPALEEAYGDLSLTYNAVNDTDDAVKVAEACLKRFPKDIPALSNLATAYHKKNEHQKAQQYEAQITALTQHH